MINVDESNVKTFLHIKLYIITYISVKTICRDKKKAETGMLGHFQFVW